MLRVQPERNEMTVSHRAIDGYMPAMAMPFHVAKGEELRGLQPGSRVTFDLAVKRSGSQARHIQKLVIDDGVPPEARPPAPRVGSAIPDFALVSEAGRTVRLSEFRGRVMALDFIYTRCPLPDVCPRLSANFAALQKRVPDLALVSITIDPEFDRPPVLADYARRYGAEPARWTFLTGSLADVRQVAGFFGLTFWNEESMIAHTVVTAIIDREGRLAGLVEGSSYRWEQVRDLAATVMQ